MGRCHATTGQECITTCEYTVIYLCFIMHVQVFSFLPSVAMLSWVFVPLIYDNNNVQPLCKLIELRQCMTRLVVLVADIVILTAEDLLYMFNFGDKIFESLSLCALHISMHCIIYSGHIFKSALRIKHSGNCSNYIQIIDLTFLLCYYVILVYQF